MAGNARYGGLRLQPQVGLIPLGADPDSTLEESSTLLGWWWIGLAPAGPLPWIIATVCLMPLTSGAFWSHLPERLHLAQRGDGRNA